MLPGVVMTGAVMSIFTTGVVNVSVLPALSVTVTVWVTPEVSVEKDRDPVAAPSTPDPLSADVYVSVTPVLFHPAALGSGLRAPNVRVGLVLSMLTPGVVNVAELPALSVTVT